MISLKDERKNQYKPNKNEKSFKEIQKGEDFPLLLQKIFICGFRYYLLALP